MKAKEENSPSILFEDDSLLVIHKPTGWIVNKAATTKGRLTIQEWIANSFNFEVAKNFKERNGIVHRIDKETSGLLLIAKTKQVKLALQSQFKQREIEKTYIALVHNRMQIDRGDINAPIARLTKNRRRFGVQVEGKSSLTFYSLIKIYKDNNEKKYSLVQVRPKTGRTHQIRVHFKHIGHPLVSDDLYLSPKILLQDRQWCPRLFLHASKIKFAHPDSSKTVEFESRLPDDLESALTSLEKLPHFK